MPYLSQDSGVIPADKQLKALEKEYNKRWYKGYMKGKKEAKEDFEDRCVSIMTIKKNRDIMDPFCMGYEVGYLREILWILTKGQIT
jgi:hypothetical protein